MERRANIGFRCARSRCTAATGISGSGVRVQPDRDYSQEKPVNDETFAGFRKQFDYDLAPLQPADGGDRRQQPVLAKREGQLRRRLLRASASRPSCFCRAAAHLPTRR